MVGLTIGLNAVSANLQTTPSWVVPLAHLKDGMPSRGTWTCSRRGPIGISSRNILLASSVLCSINPSLQGFLAPCPVCLTDHFWTLGTFDSLRFILFCIATHLGHGHSWPQVSDPISSRDQTHSVFPRHTTKLRVKFVVCICLCKALFWRAVLCNVWQSPGCPAVNPQKPKQWLSVMYMQSVLYRWYYGPCCWLWLSCSFYKFSFITFTTCKLLMQVPHISITVVFSCYVAFRRCYP